MPSRDEPTDVSYFLQPPLNPWNLDSYCAHAAILRALKQALPQMAGTALDVGCGVSPYKSVLLGPGSGITRYLALDLEGAPDSDHLDLRWDGEHIPLEAESVDCAIATEVLEHCPDPENVLREVCRVLKPGGFLFLTVPFLWPLHTVPYDEYRYTPFSLSRHLRNAGFEALVVTALGGWDAALATMLGLWVSRRGLRLQTRRVLQRLLFPIYKRLLRSDRPPQKFDSSGMITHLSATARKSFPPPVAGN